MHQLFNHTIAIRSERIHALSLQTLSTKNQRYSQSFSTNYNQRNIQKIHRKIIGTRSNLSPSSIPINHRRDTPISLNTTAKYLTSLPLLTFPSYPDVTLVFFTPSINLIAIIMEQLRYMTINPCLFSDQYLIMFPFNILHMKPRATKIRRMEYTSKLDHRIIQLATFPKD